MSQKVTNMAHVNLRVEQSAVEAKALRSCIQALEAEKASMSQEISKLVGQVEDLNNSLEANKKELVHVENQLEQHWVEEHQKEEMLDTLRMRIESTAAERDAATAQVRDAPPCALNTLLASTSAGLGCLGE